MKKQDFVAIGMWEDVINMNYDDGAIRFLGESIEGWTPTEEEALRICRSLYKVELRFEELHFQEHTPGWRILHPMWRRRKRRS